eukprot:1136803-Pelagomonas_calceolata.AAC.2
MAAVLPTALFAAARESQGWGQEPKRVERSTNCRALHRHLHLGVHAYLEQYMQSFLSGSAAIGGAAASQPLPKQGGKRKRAANKDREDSEDDEEGGGAGKTGMPALYQVSWLKCFRSPCMVWQCLMCTAPGTGILAAPPSFGASHMGNHHRKLDAAGHLTAQLLLHWPSIPHHLTHSLALNHDVLSTRIQPGQ